MTEGEIKKLITDTVKILPASLVYQEYNQKTEYLDGPYWNYDNNFATGTFEIKDQSIESVKQNLISKIAANRYIKECAGIKITIQNVEVNVDTSREGRAIFIQAYTVMADNETINWKFPEAWLTLSKSELTQIIYTGASHVQETFNWESNKTIEINNCGSLQELNVIDVGDPVIPTPVF